MGCRLRECTVCLIIPCPTIILIPTAHIIEGTCETTAAMMITGTAETETASEDVTVAEGVDAIAIVIEMLAVIVRA